jgi:putative glycerol-1-phosphate prenyltransferase
MKSGVGIDWNQQRGLVLLIDPDFGGVDHWQEMVRVAQHPAVKLIFVGGSFLHKSHLDQCLSTMQNANLPVVLFPGSSQQISAQADGMLLLSLLSGRNPDFLIGQHVQAARAIKQSGLAIWPTAYLLIDGGKPTTVSYISNTLPLPADKPLLTSATALAGELLGMRLVYLDAGSGAQRPVSMETIAAVRREVSAPIIVGGGIQSQSEVEQAWSAGANWVVIGNVLEQHPDFFSNWI